MVSLTILCSILITYVVLSQTLLSRSFAQRDPTVTFISGLMLIKSTVLLRKFLKKSSSDEKGNFGYECLEQF